MLLDPLHRRRVALASDIGFPLRRGARPGAGARGRRGQAFAHVADRSDGVRVGALEVALVGEDTGEDGDPVGQVVERKQDVGDHHRQVRQPQLVGLARSHAWLEGAHQVVAEHAHRSAGERRQVLGRGEVVAG